MVNAVRFSTFLAFMAVLSALTSCEKDAGSGGTSTVRGRVVVYRYDPSLMAIVDTVEAAEEDVYIIYGGGYGTYDDDFKCSYDGTYEFTELRKGDYRIFAYSDDTTGLSEQMIDPNRPKRPVFVDVNVGNNKSDVSAADIVIFDKR
ncbi:MAG: hypothetical protein RL213_1837 [Bacteroidota bacterium]|jgi:hypothetical protein